MELAVMEDEALRMVHQPGLEETRLCGEKEKGDHKPQSASDKQDLESEKLDMKDVESNKDIESENGVGFGLHDAENPLKWSAFRKWIIVSIVTFTFSVDVLATMIVVPAAAAILKDLGTTNDKSYYVLLVSIWEIGEGVGSLFSGPLSEALGRLPVYHTGNICFCLFAVGAALSTNISMFIAFRFLSAFSTTALALGPAIIGDIFVVEERGRPMSLNHIAPTMFSLISPLCGGYITENVGWRWTQWIIVIPSAALTVAAFIFLRETYAPILIKRKRASMPGSSESAVKPKGAVFTVLDAFVRPAKMFTLSNALKIVAIHASWGYGMVFVIVTTLSTLLRDKYGFSTGDVGLAYIGPPLGGIIALLIYANTADRLHKRLTAVRGSRPEHRLYFTLAGSLVLPIGIFLYGWTAQYHVFWIVPLIGTLIIKIGNSFILIAAENYIVDAYGDYSGSAVAANVFLRSLFGTVIPLAAPPLYRSLGYGWGDTVFGFISVGFIPIIVFMTFRGALIRNRDRYGKSDSQVKAENEVQEKM